VAIGKKVTTNCNDYSDFELEQALKDVDRDAYPENYLALKKEFNLRVDKLLPITTELSSEALNSVTSIQPKAKKSGLELLFIAFALSVISFIAAIYIVKIEAIASIPLYSAEDPVENIALALLIIAIGIVIALDGNGPKSNIEIMTGGTVTFLLSVAVFLFSLPGVFAVSILLKIFTVVFRLMLKDRI